MIHRDDTINFVIRQEIVSLIVVLYQLYLVIMLMHVDEYDEFDNLDSMYANINHKSRMLLDLDVHDKNVLNVLSEFGLINDNCENNDENNDERSLDVDDGGGKRLFVGIDV